MHNKNNQLKTSVTIPTPDLKPRNPFKKEISNKKPSLFVNPYSLFKAGLKEILKPDEAD